MLSSSVILYAVPVGAIAFLVIRYLKLSSIPGPFLASITDLWRVYQLEYAGFNENIGHVHAKYGPMVRVGPNTVYTSDPSAVSTVYSTHGDFKKADSYHPLRTLVNRKIIGSVIDMQNESENAALKRAVGHAFATKNLLDYEPDVDSTADMLVQTLRQVRSADVFTSMQQFQADFLMKAAFNRDTNYLAARKPTSDITGEERIVHWARWQALPFLEKLVYKSPFCLAWYRGSGSPPLWTTMAKEELATRQAQEFGKVAKDGAKSDLLSKYIDGATRHKDVSMELLMRMVSSTISAGFDTSAFTMSTIFYFLLKNPLAMKKLRAELNGAVSAGRLSNPPTYTEADRLKYLSAVIKESMRLYHFLPTPLERVVPAGGAEISGHWLPGGTTIAVPAPVVHRNVKVFGEDANDFRPDRWVEADEYQRIVMERTMLAFGAGKRVCLGRHIAELEMKKVIPRLLLEFDMSLDNPDYLLEPKDKYIRFMKPFSVTFSDRS
ncbi:hypothetical protein LTR20_009369 [Exophiala xenobiotica]|nr:hypothetical protein LTR92_002815 [Exophiala xenobiotica]KAK5213248.1 hypothetical protein LTR41_000827 [Exophiala xenobiotica]KAK5260093.1 hypothetical protein LTR40_004781 [Exophiala xenobiotica]KAK5320016.1 hypothetical protein LTR93_007073 [Exophiala xenobiotica]KAK5361789.1 hypothetical protein LTS13_009790 [Exophiala xenobiotica]